MTAGSIGPREWSLGRDPEAEPKMRPRELLPAWTLCVALAGLPVAALPGDSHPAGDLPGRVRYHDGLLSVRAREVPLRDLLAELAAATGLTVKSYVSPDQWISIEFDDLDPVAGLRRVLQHRSYALDLGTPAPAGDGVADHLRGTLWILPQEAEPFGGRALAARLPASDWRAEEPDEGAWLSAALTSGDPELRADALIELADGDDGAALGWLGMALGDAERDVREAAIIALTEIGGDAAANVLATALRDPEPRIREGAVDALGEIGGATAIGLVRQALSDEVDYVREAAAEMLETLRAP
jgi:hypothetical protein